MVKKPIALVLSGGGARAAYQVGILKGIASFYQRKKIPVPFQVICGTSAGAINATTLACLASNFHLSTKRLDSIWRNIHTNQIYHSDFWGVFKHLCAMIVRNFRANHANNGSPSLLNNTPLKSLLIHRVPFKLIDVQLRKGNLKALSIACSCYQAKRSITFFQGVDCRAWERAKHCGIATEIKREHLLASSAIPLIFPSVQIQDLFLGDGTIHQHAPLSAPIHLGAKKIMVINLDKEVTPHTVYQKHPSAAAITAHLLDTLFSDMIHNDLERFDQINQTLEHLNISTPENSDLPLDKINIEVINPSEDLSLIAQQYADKLPKSVQALCHMLGISKESAPNLISYLLFEPDYCRHLIALGEKDAALHKERIIQLLKDD